MPGGIGSTSDGSDSVNRSPPTENSTSCWSSTLRIVRREPHHRAAEQRMRGRKRRRARHELGIDRRAEQLGKLDQLGMRAALRHRVAGDDQRALRLREQRRGRLDRRAVAAQRAAPPASAPAGRCRPSALRMSPGSDRNTGPVGGASAVLAARCTSRGRSARRCTSVDHFTSGRAIVGRSAHRIGSVALKLWSCWPAVTRIGRARLLRVVEHAHGVAEAGRDVQVDHRELAGRLRVAVRHRHDGRLLQAEHVAQLVLGRERVHQRQFGGAGIAEHDLDAFLLEQLEEGALSGHDGQEVLPMLGSGK